jgi:hypothetical protein
MRAVVIVRDAGAAPVPALRAYRFTRAAPPLPPEQISAIVELAWNRHRGNPRARLMVFMQTQQPKIEHGRRSGPLLLSPASATQPQRRVSAA